MIVGTPFHKAKLKEKYDVIVIGSGIGSMATAACLSKAGKDVLVLEKHYTAGGFTHTYSRKGFEWDVGVHYIGEVHRKGSVLRRVFDYISDGQLKWSQMADVYDQIHLGAESFDYVSGRQNFRNKMVSYFPDEELAIDQYLDLVSKASRSSSMYYLEKALPRWLSRLFYRKLSTPYLEYATKTTDEVLSGLTKNRKLISVLTGQWGDYGLPPKESSFAMHAMVAKHYLSGAAYPVGGSSSIAKTIVAMIEKQGGQVVTRAGVAEILVRGKSAYGVRLENGQQILANIVVSGAGVENTFDGLVPKEITKSLGFEKDLSSVSNSMAHIGAYIGLKETDEALGLNNTNLWLYQDENFDENVKAFMEGTSLDFPVIYISFPSSKDPAWQKNYPGKSTIEIVAPTPYSWFKKWEGTKWQKRGDDYKAFKKEMTDVLLESLYKHRPQLKGKIEFVELSTPLSTACFSNYRQGQLYGLNHNPDRFKKRWLTAQTPIKKLYLTGQDVVTCGVGGGLIAGVLTSISVLGLWKAKHLIGLMTPKRS